MSAQSITEALAKSGWQVAEEHCQWPDRGKSVVSFQKQMHDGLDVIVSIHVQGDQFQVWSSAAHRSSGPCDTCDQTVPSLGSAMQAAQFVCEDWDAQSD